MMEQNSLHQRKLAAIMFTDMVGYSALAQKNEALSLKLLEEHRSILRGILPRYNGREIETAGDSFFVEFESALVATRCSIEIQQRLHERNTSVRPEEAIVIRVGLHLGDVVYVGNHVHGDGVNIAARLETCADPGGICISEDVARQIQNKIEYPLRRKRTRQLKNISLPVEIYSIVLPWQDQEDERALEEEVLSRERIRNNLPPQLTRLIGREHELKQAQELLSTSRLLTLTGPGGTGKTRLAIQLASEVMEQFDDGVFFAHLGTINDHSLVMVNIGQLLGINGNVFRSEIEGVVDYVRQKRMLLILDNFEQVIAAAPSVAELLASCPNLKIIVTSRVVLRIKSEQEFPVPPLGLPDRRKLPSAESLSQYAAVALFIQRATAVRPDFTVNNENAPAVAEICYRLDGLPLAIELAAARIKLFSPQAMLGRLQSRLELLKGGSQDLPERHQTLRHAIAWSYDVLPEDEKALFRRLSIFVGGWSLDSAEQICMVPDRLSLDMLDGIAALVDKSLLRMAEDTFGTDPRFSMLETIREFGLESLKASGEYEVVVRAHAEFFLNLAREAAPQLTGPRQKLWFDRLERELDNFRAALDWVQEHNEAEIGMNLGTALWRYWVVRGHMNEGMQRLRELLLLPGAAARTSARAKVLNAVGTIAHEQSWFHEAIGPLEESLSIFREIGDEKGIAQVLNNIGWVAIFLGEHDKARAYSEEALALNKRLGEERGVAIALNNLGWLANFRSEYEDSARFHRESLKVRQAVGDERGAAFAKTNLGWSELYMGNYDKAEELLNEGRSTLEQLGDLQIVAFNLSVLATIRAHAGEYQAALDLSREGIRLMEAVVGNRWGSAWGGSLAGFMLTLQGKLEEALPYLDESLAMFRGMGNPWGIGSALCRMGMFERKRGKVDRARELHDESLKLRESVSDRFGMSESLLQLAGVLVELGDLELAATHLATAQEIREAGGFTWALDEKRENEQIQMAIRSARGQVGVDKS